MVEPATKEHTFSKPDWSLLPKELLHIISKNVDDCFDLVHARSVCTSWRSTFPFPSCLLRPSYSLPTFAEFPNESKDSCTLEKISLFLFRARTPSASVSEYFLGGVGRDESEDHTNLSPPLLQCSVKVDIPESDPTLMNMLDCHILPLGHLYIMIDCNPRDYIGVAFLPLNNEGGGGGGEFVVLVNYTTVLLVLTSAEMKWKRLENVADSLCWGIVAFRGRFYAVFLNRNIFVIDPYSLESTLLMPPSEFLNSGCFYLVPSGDDELFLDEKIIPRTGAFDSYRLTLRVSRLDEKASKWVTVKDLGDRVLFTGHMRNVSCSGKELPDGCGVSVNSIIMTLGPGDVTYSYKYGVDSGREEDDLDCWRFSLENRVTVLGTSKVLALRVEH